jgi:hypothetical protein
MISIFCQEGICYFVTAFKQSFRLATIIVRCQGCCLHANICYKTALFYHFIKKSLLLINYLILYFLYCSRANTTFHIVESSLFHYPSTTFLSSSVNPYNSYTILSIPLSVLLIGNDSVNISRVSQNGFYFWRRPIRF